MAAPRTHYDILNVSPDAETVVIEAAYRALMKKYHPDQGAPASGPGTPTAADINEAYAVLREAARRADYDRSEWTRQQNIQLASYVPPPAPRRSNFFGWGGWLVALVLAGMIGIMATRGKTTLLSPAEKARAALMAEPDLRSQPFKPGEKALSDADVAEIRAEAFVGPVPESVAPDEAPQLPPSNAARAPRRAAGGGRAVRKPGRRSVPAARPRHEKDFLEREGYIY